MYLFLRQHGGAPKERRRRRAEKRLTMSKRVILKSPSLLCPLKVFRTFQLFQKQTLRGQRRNGLSKITLLDNRFSARRLRRSFSQSPDLPPPHGLAPSETMVSDHGLGPPLSTENPRNKGFSGSGAPIFGFGLADRATKG